MFARFTRKPVLCLIASTTGSRAAVLRRSEPTRFSSASDDKDGGFPARSARSRAQRAEQSNTHLAQPADQGVATDDDIISGAKFIIGVSLRGVAWPKVDRRDAHRTEPCHICPPKLRGRLAPNRAKEFCSSRLIEARSGTSSDIKDVNRIAIKNFAYVGLSFGRGLVGGESVVDLDDTAIGDDIAHNAATDPDGIQPFSVGQPVDFDLLGLVRAQTLQHRARVVNSVVAHPGSR